jgi:hypothetical protein
MFKLKVISKIMICWNQNCIIHIPKSNEGLRYIKYILFIHVLVIKVFSVINHVFEFKFSKEWSMKCYSIKKIKIKILNNFTLKKIII